MNYDRIVQLLVIGDSSVGKTSLITRYTNGTFKEEYLATVGLDYYSKNEEFNNQTIQVKL
jgi:Ras-related protein Rab-18